MWDLTIYPFWGPPSDVFGLDVRCFVPLFNRGRISQSTVFGVPPSDVFGLDTICNSPSLLLADIVYFNPLHIVVGLTISKFVC